MGEIKELILRLKKNYIHKIKIDEFLFQMTFLDYPLDKAIIERIEGLREPNTISLIKALVMPNSKVLELGGCYGYFANEKTNKTLIYYPVAKNANSICKTLFNRRFRFKK